MTCKTGQRGWEERHVAPQIVRSKKNGPIHRTRDMVGSCCGELATALQWYYGAGVRAENKKEQEVARKCATFCSFGVMGERRRLR